MDNERFHCFKGNVIRNDFFAGFPRAIYVISHTQNGIALGVNGT